MQLLPFRSQSLMTNQIRKRHNIYPWIFIQNRIKLCMTDSLHDKLCTLEIKLAMITNLVKSRSYQITFFRKSYEYVIRVLTTKPNKMNTNIHWKWKGVKKVYYLKKRTSILLFIMHICMYKYVFRKLLKLKKTYFEGSWIITCENVEKNQITRN